MSNSSLSKREVRELVTLSAYENNRAKNIHPDPRNIANFKELENVIEHSLKKPNLIRSKTPSGNQLIRPRLETRNLQDEALLKKILGQRPKLSATSKVIPSRIIRKGDA